MRRWPRAMLALAVLAACTSTNTAPPRTASPAAPPPTTQPSTPAPTQAPAPEPTPAPAVVLPAISTPTSGPLGLSAVATGPDGQCEGDSTCVPPGVYQQQPTPGDWCFWTYLPAGAPLDLMVEGWKDADGQRVTLNEGDQLSYGPSIGAFEFSEGFAVFGPDVPGDDIPRGCGEWVLVDHATTPSPLGPTEAECRQAIAAGEEAAAALGSLGEGIAEEARRLEALSGATTAELNAGAAEDILATFGNLVDMAAETTAAILGADAKMRHARVCHDALGETTAGDDMVDKANRYRGLLAELHLVFAELLQACLEEFGPVGFDCSRL